MGNARVPPEMLAHGRLEKAVVELADVVVSPSAYMVEWMRDQGWQLPEPRVIPLVTRATATGERLLSRLPTSTAIGQWSDWSSSGGCRS